MAPLTRTLRYEAGRSALIVATCFVLGPRLMPGVEWDVAMVGTAVGVAVIAAWRAVARRDVESRALSGVAERAAEVDERSRLQSLGSAVLPAPLGAAVALGLVWLTEAAGLSTYVAVYLSLIGGLGVSRMQRAHQVAVWESEHSARVFADGSGRLSARVITTSR